MRDIGTAERRDRLGLRHLLARPGDDVAGVADALVALHATDPATVFLAAGARMSAPGPGPVEKALYDDRALVRMLGMRRTMFVVPAGLVPVVQASSTDAVAARERRLLVKHLTAAGVAPDPAAWLREVEDETHRALLARGEATGAELGRDVARLRTQIDPVPGKAYSRPGNITSRVLALLAADGHIVRGRPLGSWLSSQYKWSAVEAWLPGLRTPVGAADARAELAGRWLAAYGPGTAADLKWWTGWTGGEVKAALAALGAVSVGLSGRTGYVLPGDAGPPPSPGPWAALLPALDPTAMGWYEREWYLGEHAPLLFDRTGNIGPTIWWNGRIVGGWAQRPDGGIALRLLEDIGAEGRAAVDARAASLHGWLDGIRITPRFRTPLERELSA